MPVFLSDFIHEHCKGSAEGEQEATKDWRESSNELEEGFQSTSNAIMPEESKIALNGRRAGVVNQQLIY